MPTFTMHGDNFVAADFSFWGRFPCDM